MSPDPMQQAEDVIDRIQEVLESISITSSSFPDIQNPFNKSFLPEITLGSTPVGQLPPLVSGATATPNIIGAQNISIPYNQLPTQEQKLQRIDTVNKAVR
jgi:hypothetical protein